MGRHLISGALLWGACSGGADALPVVVDIDLIAPLSVVDFQDFSDATFGSSVDLGAVTFRSRQAALRTGAVNCRDINVRCLLDMSGRHRDERVFAEFEYGTNAFGFDLISFDQNDRIVATVTGESGVSIFDLSGGGIFGFADLEGLASISFANAGSHGGGVSNYSFDSLVVGRLYGGGSVVMPVPLPPAGVLLLCGMAAMALVRGGRKTV